MALIVAIQVTILLGIDHLFCSHIYGQSVSIIFPVKKSISEIELNRWQHIQACVTPPMTIGQLDTDFFIMHVYSFLQCAL